jgi:hypothetical protein
MTRNIVIVKADGEFRSYNEAAEDEHLLSLGARDAVIAALSAGFPGLALDESGSGAAGGYTIEVGIDDPVEDVTVVLDDAADIETVLAFVRENGWHATESGGGAFLDL